MRFSFTLLTLMLVLSFVGCSRNDGGNLPAVEEKKIPPILPVVEKKKSRPTMERPAVYGKGVLAYRGYELERFSAHSSKVSKDSMNTIIPAWQEAMEMATDKEVAINNRPACGLFLYQLDTLWKNDQFQESLVDKYLTRIKRVPREAIEEWQVAIQAVYPPYRAVGIRDFDFTKAETVAFLIQLEPLFKGEVFDGDKAKHLLTRLQSIKPEASQAWADAIDAIPVQAALVLIQNDSLFTQEQFQERAFREELDAIKRLNPK